MKSSLYQTIKKLNITKPPLSEQLVPVPWPFIILSFHYTETKILTVHTRQQIAVMCCCNVTCRLWCVPTFIPLHEKFLQFDWLRAVVFQLNLKYLHVKITKPLQIVVLMGVYVKHVYKRNKRKYTCKGFPRRQRKLSIIMRCPY